MMQKLWSTSMQRPLKRSGGAAGRWAPAMELTVWHTASTSTAGQASIGPRGVRDQSKTWTSSDTACSRSGLPCRSLSLPVAKIRFSPFASTGNGVYR